MVYPRQGDRKRVRGPTQWNAGPPGSRQRLR
jgi:hypothetical protein